MDDLRLGRKNMSAFPEWLFLGALALVNMVGLLFSLSSPYLLDGPPEGTPWRKMRTGLVMYWIGLFIASIVLGSTFWRFSWPLTGCMVTFGLSLFWIVVFSAVLRKYRRRQPLMMGAP